MHGPYDDMHNETIEECREKVEQVHTNNKNSKINEDIKYCPYCGKLLK